jgi:ribosomal protein L29
MTIKGANGENYNVTSQGQGALNTVLGAAGTASFLGLNAGNILGGCGRNNGLVEVITSDDRPVSRYEAGMMDKLAAKDAEIALLKSNTYTDQKLADVYDRLVTKINQNKEEQAAINMQQAVYNGTNTATLGCMKQQIAELQGLTELVVPQRRVCDTGCGCNQ